VIERPVLQHQYDNVLNLLEVRGMARLSHHNLPCGGTSSIRKVDHRTRMCRSPRAGDLGVRRRRARRHRPPG
jgi:hypothetical protein